MNVHTPGWVGYAGNKMYTRRTCRRKMIVAQRIDTALHVGTHFDGAMHGNCVRHGRYGSPIRSIFWWERGAVVDVSQHMDDWAVITPAMIESAPSSRSREGDILIIHTGWQRYWEGQPQQDLVRYFCDPPRRSRSRLLGVDAEKKKIKWFGIDCGSADHSMNTSICHMRPDIA